MFDIKKIYIFLKEHFSKKDVAVIIGLIVLFFLTRLIRLDQWPIFTDEGIYINWAEVARRDAAWRFVSLTDGRQPLQTWGIIPFLKLFPNNALLAGRLFSVTTGFVGLIGTFTLLFYLWGKRAAYIGAVLFIFMPYFLFYDRMALIDSGVNAGFIWILFFSILLARTRRFDVAILLGVTAGFALLAKSSSRMFLMLAAFAPLLFFEKKWKKIILPSINYYVMFGLSFLIALVFYNIQRLSPYMHFIEQKNTTFVLTFSEWIKDPFQIFWGNFKSIPLVTAWEAGWVIFPLAMMGMYMLYKKERNLFFYLLTFFILPWLAISFFAKVMYPRYLIFFGSLYLITATYFIQSLDKRKSQLVILFLLGSMIAQDYPLIFDPVKASFPEVDRGQYIESVAAVWGADEAVEFLREQSQDEHILVLAEGDFGLIADVLRVYVNDDDKIEIKGLWPLELSNLQEYQAEAQKRDVYIVFSHRQEFPPDWPITLERKYHHPVGEKALYLYSLNPPSNEE